MKKRSTQYQLEALIALLLFTVFAVCVLTVLLTGANAYSRINERDQATYNQRTYMQYMAARVRQADTINGISVEKFGSSDALSLYSRTAGGNYITHVYCYNGYLMELYASESASLNPEDGEKIMEAAELKLSMNGNLLTATITDIDGTDNTLHMSVRSGKAAEI